MKLKILDSLPLGVSFEILEAIQKIAIPVAKHRVQIWGGFDVILNSTYPLTLDDGTIIDGVMIGANNSRCYLIREARKKV